MHCTKIRGGDRFFRQVDREESLIHLLRVNILKRMESSVASFALTVQRQLADVDALLAKIDAHDDSIEELPIDHVDIDDPAFETLLVGRKVKVLLQDVDRVRWRQDLAEDRKRLKALLAAAHLVTPERGAKLAALKTVIADKPRTPINPGNRKVLVFTAFAGTNRTTLPRLRGDMSSILSTFSPRSKGCPAELATEGEIDLLIAAGLHF
jgi:hypothetical protein